MKLYRSEYISEEAYISAKSDEGFQKHITNKLAVELTKSLLDQNIFEREKDEIVHNRFMDHIMVRSIVSVNVCSTSCGDCEHYRPKDGFCNRNLCGPWLPEDCCSKGTKRTSKTGGEKQ